MSTKNENKLVAVVLVAILLLVVTVFVAYNTGYDDGYDDGVRDASVTTLTPFEPFSPPEQNIEWYEPPMTEDEQIMLLLDKFADSVETANITIEWDGDGTTKGSIHIFYNTKG